MNQTHAQMDTNIQRYVYIKKLWLKNNYQDILNYTAIHTHENNLKTHIHIHTEENNFRWNPKPLPHTHTHTHTHTQRIKYQDQMRGKVDEGKYTLRKREEWPS